MEREKEARKQYYQYMPYKRDVVYSQSEVTPYDESMMELEDERDLEYMRRLFPDILHEIQDCIDDECDKLEYDGSMMYDEYPDKETLYLLIDRLFDRLKYLEEMNSNNYYNNNGNMYNGTPMNNRNGMPDIQTTGHKKLVMGGANWLKYLIEVMTMNEMFGRRRKYYRRRKKCHTYSTSANQVNNPNNYFNRY